ncbi:hypothetical protein ACEN9H_08445 [Massilia cellulosiltytica]|uniref:hypothetical protein n=1 Tax=Massilia cellulosiltytica TaxID=2683234 RepID=UPI0039B5187A
MLKVDRIALIPHAPGLNVADVYRVAAAIQQQVLAHFARDWHLSAGVAVQSEPSDGVVPVFIVSDDLGGLAGFHMLKNGWPYAVVRYGPTWSVAASHEVLELIADPTGDRTALGNWSGGPCSYVVEVCDPCQLVNYPCNGVLVSDFCLPAYYEQNPPPGSQLSWCNAIKGPKQVLPGGTLAWITQTSQLMQATVDAAGVGRVATLGSYTPGVLGARAQLGALDQTYTRLSHLKLSSAERKALNEAKREATSRRRTVVKLFKDEMQRRLQVSNFQPIQGGGNAKPSDGPDVRPRARRMRSAQGPV